MPSHKTVLALMSAAALAAACGDDGNDVDPELIPGGGVADPGIDGEVNVFVIDEVTGDPIAGAAVDVGATADLVDVEGETDADGLFVATGVSGPQSITVVASGYVTGTWVGVDGANVTIPMDTNDVIDPADVPQGTVSGTIEGWDAMQPPPGGAIIALIGYSSTHEDDDPANNIPTPGEPAPNQCFKADGGGATPCDFTVNTRIGSMAIYAMIGTTVDFQTITITDFAYASGVAVDDNEDVTGITLEVADAADLVIDPDIGLPSPPSGLDRVQALVAMDIGDDGRLLLPQDIQIAPDVFISFPIPETSLFAGSSYDVIGIADTESPDDNAQSVGIVRGVTDIDGASVGTLLPLPGGLSTDGATFSFEAVTGASLHTFAVMDGADTVWGVAVLDGSVEVPLAVAADLPTGSLTYTVQALEIPDLDLRDFAIDDVTDTVTRSSGDQTSFTN